jgi:CDP-diacylglycerol--glycerol-3-phosphate 3-phosphatidyltransferase
MVAILSSLLVSYARARAEGLGMDCKVGIAQRAERIVALGVTSLVVGAGPHALLLEAIVALLALASIITVVQRFVYVHRHADVAPVEPVRLVEGRRPALDRLAKKGS